MLITGPLTDTLPILQRHGPACSDGITLSLDVA